MAFSPEEAKEVAYNIGSFPLVVKTQIHAGDRGKAGGIHVCENLGGLGELCAEVFPGR